jgi:hypothetical protein
MYGLGNYLAGGVRNEQWCRRGTTLEVEGVSLHWRPTAVKAARCSLAVLGHHLLK